MSSDAPISERHIQVGHLWTATEGSKQANAKQKKKKKNDTVFIK